MVVLVAVFLGRALIEGFSQASRYEWRFDLPYLMLSVFLILIYYAQQWGGWRLVMRRFGDPLSAPESAAIWFSSILGRYVPGSVAMVVGRIGMCRKRGIPASTTFASIIYENALILITALILTAASVPFWPPFPFKEYAVLLVSLAPLCLVLLHPAVFSRLANAVLGRFKRGPLQTTLPFRQVLALIPYYLGGWVILGLGFAALCEAISPVSWGELPLLVGGYAFAWEIGFLALVTPSGFGVKEAALYAVARLAFPPPVAAAVVVLSRLWQTLAEVGATAIVWAIAGKSGALKELRAGRSDR